MIRNVARGRAYLRIWTGRKKNIAGSFDLITNKSCSTTICGAVYAIIPTQNRQFVVPDLQIGENIHFVIKPVERIIGILSECGELTVDEYGVIRIGSDTKDGGTGQCGQQKGFCCLDIFIRFAFRGEPDGFGGKEHSIISSSAVYYIF